MKIDKNIVEELVNKGLKDSEISKILKCSEIGVYFCRKRNNINRPSFSISKGIKPSEYQISFLIGCLLGDGHMRIDKKCINLRFICEHGIKQKEYCKWKFDILKSLNPKYRICKRKTKDKRTDKYYESSKVFLGNNPELLFIYNMFYKDKKIINKEIYKYFDDLSLAVMYMDDGYKYLSSIYISTDCFSKMELENFISFIFKKYKIKFNIHKGNKLYLQKKYYSTFKKIILPFVHETMMYKLH
jgi:hypothetical protein